MISIIQRLLLLLAPLASTTAALHAQDSLEIKYLAPNAATLGQLKTTLGLDPAAAKKSMEIYFFDTPTLTLHNTHHLILRLRKKGEIWTLTLKQRPAGPEAHPLNEFTKLETDESIGSGDKVISYSIDKSLNPTEAKALITSGKIQEMLSPAQRSQLKSSADQIPWDQVRCFPKIDAQQWSLTDPIKLDAELWTYPTGEVLELSCKAKTTDTAAAEKKFTTYLTDHQIDPKQGGPLKTTIVLEALAKQLPPK